ncbi:MAG: 3'-5' exonuclease [Candidatus Sericytochromatia bacterium]|nr:3'-5' exonuclease [Candidatus Sericytochromatia bacterium]
MNALLETQSFIVVDIETTGYGPPEHAITEIAALRIWQGQVTDRYATLVNPRRPIPSNIVQLTGITNHMVANAPSLADVMQEFWLFAGPAPLVAHNSSFDRRFLNHAAEQALGKSLENPDLCTVRMARKIHPELPSRSLGPLAEHYGISINGRHRAMGDAEATATIFLQFLQRLSGEGIEDLAMLMAYQQSAAKRRTAAKSSAMLPPM